MINKWVEGSDNKELMLTYANGVFSVVDVHGHTLYKFSSGKEKLEDLIKDLQWDVFGK